jgi:hypothetical protein
MYETPGVYFEQAQPLRALTETLRTDVAGFMGYAERGPLGVAIRLISWRQFLASFGEPLSFAYLGYAVRGFFDNGGQVCYVTRVADADRARCARLTLTGEDGLACLRLETSHGTLIDPTTGQPVVNHTGLSAGLPRCYSSPGAWGNRLAVEVLPDSAGSTSAPAPQPEDGQQTYVDNLTGFKAGSVVRFIQEGLVAPSFHVVKEVIPSQMLLVWKEPLTSLDLKRSFQLETVEFRLRVLLDGQIVEDHPRLSLSAALADRYVETGLQNNSHYLKAEVLLLPGELTQPGRWPQASEPLPLTSGQDGLSTVTKDHFLAALDCLAQVDEISLLAAPDVVLRVEAPALPLHPGARGANCSSLEPLPKGRIRGKVITVGPDGAPMPVADVTITPLNASAASVYSHVDGTFELAGLPVEQISLRLVRAGFFLLETTTQAGLVVSDPELFSLAPVTLPPAFDADTIADIQQVMANQGERGLYRVALLDPPGDRLKIEPIQTWRRRFDSSHAALFYPWMVISLDGETRQVPPSGHVAGQIARTDLAYGVHRAPANFALEGVNALSNEIGDAEQGVLNQQGINCLRALTGRGIRVFGSRTLSSDPQWTYLNVRRLVLMIEEAIEEASQWVVFEPNNELLRQIVSHNLATFLDSLWRRGALAGSTPAEAYLVKVDADNNPAPVVDAGQIIAEISVAPTRPYEFIHFRLGRTIEAVTVRE